MPAFVGSLLGSEDPMTPPRRPQRLAGKRVLITGASSGVGLAAARRFAAEGARLALISRRRQSLLDRLRTDGVEATVISADLADAEATRLAVREAVEALGGLDVLVSNAAAAVFGHLLEVHPEDFDRTVDVTFTGAVRVIREALPDLRASGGVVVATGSLMSRLPLPTWSSYSAAKHALRGFLNTLRIEEREQGTGVRVSIVHPGAIDTPLFANASSATGRKPRVPPDSSTADTIARGLVAVAIDPRPEVVLGGQARLLDLLFSGARPVAETVLLVVDRWYRSGGDPAPRPGSLWRSPEISQVSAGIPSRESLLAPLQLGRRLMPAPATPARLARNVVSAGRLALSLAGGLARRVDEVDAPARSLREATGGRPAKERQRATV